MASSDPLIMLAPSDPPSTPVSSGMQVARMACSLVSSTAWSRAGPASSNSSRRKWTQPKVARPSALTCFRVIAYRIVQRPLLLGRVVLLDQGQGDVVLARSRWETS